MQQNKITKFAFMQLRAETENFHNGKWKAEQINKDTLIISGRDIWQMILYESNHKIKLSYITDSGATFVNFRRLEDLIEYEKELITKTA